MNLCRYLPHWLQRLLRCRRIIVRVEFAIPRCDFDLTPFAINWSHDMSDQVTLNASSTSAQSVEADANAVINGQPGGFEFTWASSDETVATVRPPVAGASTATVQGIADPAGASTRTCTITASVINGTVSGTGTVTVVTTADTVVVTVDFGTPTP